MNAVRRILPPFGNVRTIIITEKQFDNMEISEENHYRMLTLLAKVSIMTKDLSRALEACEDLEKLLFVWQDATNIREQGDRIDIQEELHSADGFTFSKLIIQPKE